MAKTQQQQQKEVEVLLAWNQSARQLFRWCASWHFMDLHTHGGGYIYDCCGRLCLGPFHKANNEQSSSLGRQIYPPFPTRDAPVCTPKNTCHNNKWQNKECLDLSSTSQVTDQAYPPYITIITLWWLEIDDVFRVCVGALATAGCTQVLLAKLWKNPGG